MRFKPFIIVFLLLISFTRLCAQSPQGLYGLNMNTLDNGELEIELYPIHEERLGESYVVDTVFDNEASLTYRYTYIRHEEIYEGNNLYLFLDKSIFRNEENVAHKARRNVWVIDGGIYKIQRKGEFRITNELDEVMLNLDSDEEQGVRLNVTDNCPEALVALAVREAVETEVQNSKADVAVDITLNVLIFVVEVFGSF